MSAALTVTDNQPISAGALEHILGTGDLSRLSVQQRVEFYAKTCASMGLNPLTRPFRFLTFQGQTVMYATRDCTDQLRSLRKISIQITDQRIDGDLFIVTARASTPDGRTDEDIGAVTLGKLMGEARANGTMKALTKAKRRVTLSIVGLGMLSEDELDTMPGAVTYDAEAESPPPPANRRDKINAEVPLRETPADPPTPPQRTRGQFLEALAISVRDAKLAENAAEAVDRLICHPDVLRAKETFRNGNLERLTEIIADALAFIGAASGELPEVRIVGEEKILAG